MSKTSLLFGWVTLQTLGARVDSKFWYGLADHFRSCDQSGELCAELFEVRSGVPVRPWTPRPFRHTARNQFERLALEAWSGLKLAVDTHNQDGGIYFSRLVGAWLDVVWGCVLAPKAFLQAHKENGVECAWTIDNVSKASAEVCTILANEAREIELESQTNTTAAVAPPAQPDHRECPVDRAAARMTWMETKRPGWSLNVWSQHTGVAYATLRKYRDGKTTRQTPRIRQELAQFEKVPFASVPE